MARTKTTEQADLPKTFDRLLAMHAPRPIHDRAGLQATQVLVDRMAVETLNAEQVEYLELLTTLIEKYEAENVPIDTSSLDPIDTIKYLMSGRQMNASDLGRLLGNRALGSKILNGERELSKAHLARLCDHFRVSPGVFFKMRRKAG